MYTRTGTSACYMYRYMYIMCDSLKSNIKQHVMLIQIQQNVCSLATFQDTPQYPYYQISLRLR